MAAILTWIAGDKATKAGGRGMVRIYIFTLLCVFMGSSFAIAQDDKTSTEVKVEDAQKDEEVKQAEEEAEESSPSDGRVEKLEVTGSYIRRTDVEGPSPVVVIDREEIAKSGFNDVSTVLARSTSNPFGGVGGLKGLGSARQLVLINGQRAPGSGSSYATGAVSTNFVPIAAVERIEVLKDGASATYGSDALGGVINIITRKDLDGIAFANKYDMTGVNGSDENITSVAYGSQSAKSNFLTSLQLRYRQGDRTSDRDFQKDLNNNFVFSSNYKDGNTIPPRLFAAPGCSRFNSVGLCELDNGPNDISDPALGADLVTNYTYDISSDTQFYTTVIAGFGQSGGSFPNIFNTPGDTVGLLFTPADPIPGFFTSLPNYTPANDIRIYHGMLDLPYRDTNMGYNGSLIFGFKGYVGESDWQWDVTSNNQININETKYEDLATVTGARAAILSGAFDPFSTTQRDLTGVAIDAFNRNRAVVNWVEAKTNGELGSLLGFDWAAAFGVSGAYFEYADHRNSDIVNGNVMMISGVVGRGSRELYSFFTEFSGIVASKFELQASLRGDFYSDFGQTFNPKLAARYQPYNWLTLRSSFGTGFQAPTLQNMNATLEGYERQVDQVRCKNPAFGNNDPTSEDCQVQTMSFEQNPNQSLQEETSISFNFGTIIQPTKNFSASLDWWYVKVENTIFTNLTDILELEEQDASIPVNYGVNIIREGGSPTGRILRLEYQLQNIGLEEATGIDLELNYKLPTTIGEFNFGNETVYMGTYYQQFYSEFGKRDIIGRFNRPRWRNVFTTGWSKGEWGAQVVARSVADMQKRVIGLGKIVSVTQYDLMVSYDPSWAGRFQLGAINIGNIRPRFDTTTRTQVNTAFFRPFETYYLRYDMDF